MVVKTVNDVDFQIDEADADLIAPYRWFAYAVAGSKYATYVMTEERLNGRSRRVYLHRLLTGAPKGRDVDHVNGDGCDNRRQNLRVVTRSRNLFNRSNGATRASGTGIRGVEKRLNKNGTTSWRGCFKAFGKKTHIGTFRSAEEARFAVETAIANHLSKLEDAK